MPQTFAFILRNQWEVQRKEFINSQRVALTASTRQVVRHQQLVSVFLFHFAFFQGSTWVRGIPAVAGEVEAYIEHPW